MNKPHKHAEIIKAWADGADVEWWHPMLGWVDVGPTPNWPDSTYRIKPEPKPDDIAYVKVDSRSWRYTSMYANLKLTFDGDTGALKSAEVLS